MTETATHRPIPPRAGFLASALRDLRSVARRDAVVAADDLHGAGGRRAGLIARDPARARRARRAGLPASNGVDDGGAGDLRPDDLGLLPALHRPVLGVFYGTSLIADEVEDKTITYLFTRPIPRGAVLVGKYLAYLACTIFVVLPSVMIVYLLVVPMRGSLGGVVPRSGQGPGAAGARAGGLRRACSPSSAPVQAAAAGRADFRLRLGAGRPGVPGYLKKFTVAYYLQALVPHAMPNDSGS